MTKARLIIETSSEPVEVEFDITEPEQTVGILITDKTVKINSPTMPNVVPT